MISFLYKKYDNQTDDNWSQMNIVRPTHVMNYELWTELKDETQVVCNSVLKGVKWTAVTKCNQRKVYKTNVIKLNCQSDQQLYF